MHRGKLLSRAHLLRQVWGQGYETETEYVRVYISLPSLQAGTAGQPPAHHHQAKGGRPHGRADGGGAAGPAADPAGWLQQKGSRYPLRVTIRLPGDLISHTITARRHSLTSFTAFCAHVNGRFGFPDLTIPPNTNWSPMARVYRVRRAAGPDSPWPPGGK